MSIDILLVEDSQDDAALALRALKNDNPSLKVLHVKDGAEAVDYFFAPGRLIDSRGLPKVVILDNKLPKLTGPEVLKILRSDPLTVNVPVVVMTSSSQDSDVSECYRLGANSYLVKPIDFADFREMITLCSRYWVSHNVSMTN